jgi:Zn-dependent membrane protease YugP
MMWMQWDPVYWLFAVPGILLGIWAQVRLSSAYGKYSQVPVESGMSGAEAAREILDRAGLDAVPVEEVPGQLTDHYDPSQRVLRLSSENFRGHTIAAIGVAAHEAGHALQHQQSDALFGLRMALVPLTQFATNAWMGLAILGMFLHLTNVLLVPAIAIFSVLTLFQLITLPVEYDASRRAKEQLFRLGLVQEQERVGISKVLGAAALTYVAALVTSGLNLLYLISRARDSRS